MEICCCRLTYYNFGIKTTKYDYTGCVEPFPVVDTFTRGSVSEDGIQLFTMLPDLSPKLDSQKVCFPTL